LIDSYYQWAVEFQSKLGVVDQIHLQLPMW
jgi:hypothetical protein